MFPMSILGGGFFSYSLISEVFVFVFTEVNLSS